MSLSTRFLKECARVFVFAFVAAFAPSVSGILGAPNWQAGKAAVVSATFAALAVAVKALVDLLTKDVEPLPSVGILPPEVKN